MRPRLGVLVAVPVLLVLGCTSSPGDDADKPLPEPSESGTDGHDPDGRETDGVDDRMVDIGGRSLHLVCRGRRVAGQPTVVIEAGPDGTADDSVAVQDEIGSFTRVCAYDRAGLGGSDPAPPGVRTSQDQADDLTALLDAADLEGRYLLVAQALTAWAVTLYVDQHPDTVAALVLVDPRGPRVPELQAAALPPRRGSEPAGVTEARVRLRDGFYTADEPLSIPASQDMVSAVLDRPGPAYGDVRVVVLGATGVDLPDLPAPLWARWLAIWREEQRSFAAESTRGSFRIANSAGQMYADRPEAVISAVRDLVLES